MPGIQVMSDEEAQKHFDNFFEDVFVELEDKYGEIEEMNICDNLGDHLVGNVYVKFRREEDADKAVRDLNNRWFAGRPIYAELSPVTDFREACCRQYEMSECTRSGFCNFMHLKPISRELRREFYGRSRSGAPGSARDRSRSRERESGRGERRRRSRSRDRRDEVGSRRSRSRDREHRKSSRKSSHEPRSRDEGRSKSRDRKSRDDHKRRGSSTDKEAKKEPFSPNNSHQNGMP
jgi:splicing factor U2AF subunit